MMLAAALLFAAAPLRAEVADLSWLTGTWIERKPDGDWTEEYWTPPRGGTMLGAGLTGTYDSLRHFEHLRIVTGEGGSIALYAMPMGRTAVMFPMARMGKDEIVFENANNDYPQRVSYRREGDRMIAAISLIDGSRERRWEYRRPRN